MRTERPINGLESLFAACNIRFALLVDLGDSVKEEDVLQRTHEACRCCRIGHLALAKTSNDDEGKGEWSLVTNTDDEAAASVTQRDTVVDIADDEGIGRLLNSLILQENLPVKGPISIQMIPYQSPIKKSGWMLYVNGNHAICDGRSMTQFVAVATKAIMPEPAATPLWSHVVLSDWRDMIRQAPKPETWQEDPKFLLGPHQNPMLGVREMCAQQTSKGGESFRLELSGEDMASLRKALKAKAKGATMSGVFAAVIMHSLAKEYTGEAPRDVGVSMLVDLRPHLGHNEWEGAQIPQAHGTVTLIDSCNNNLTSTECGDSEARLVNFIIHKALEMTLQLRTRIERGEAHRSALALTAGQFGEAGPPATIEMSNLGVCNIPKGSKLYTAQRFDGYDGVSCLVHSESDTGRLQWSVSVGEGLDSELVQRVFVHAIELCHRICKAWESE